MSWQFNKRSIPESEWSAIANHCATTHSRAFRPLSGGAAFTYHCLATDFLIAETCLVRFISPSGDPNAHWEDRSSRPITIRDFVKNEEFVKSVNGDRAPSDYGPLTNAKLITMHCSTCDRRVVIDGVHRIVRIASENNGGALLEVTELSGTAWPWGMPDMSKICRCISSPAMP